MTKKAKLKVWLIIIGIIIILLLGAAFVLAHKTVKAQLMINQGDVQVDKGKGYSAAVDGMELGNNDKVKTGADGKATIILFESDIVRLEPNTEIQISKLTSKENSIKQESGITWSKINKLGGIEEFNIETPTTVATVRGTGFKTKVIDEDSDEFLVGDGIVSAFNKKNQQTQDINQKEKFKFFRDRIEKGELTDEDIAFIENNENADINDLKKLRMLLIKRDKVLSKVMNKFQKEENQEFFDDLDNGRISEDEVLQKMPYKPAVIKKIVKINQRIRERQSR